MESTDIFVDDVVQEEENQNQIEERIDDERNAPRPFVFTNPGANNEAFVNAETDYIQLKNLSENVNAQSQSPDQIEGTKILKGYPLENIIGDLNEMGLRPDKKIDYRKLASLSSFTSTIKPRKVQFHPQKSLKRETKELGGDSPLY